MTLTFLGYCAAFAAGSVGTVLVLALFQGREEPRFSSVNGRIIER